MKDTNTVLRPDEKYVLSLRALFESAGYRRYRTGKFEKYDLYLENRSFLGEGDIIALSEPGGALLALRPDMTLSIVKNSRASAQSPDRVYYTENVYRTQGSDRTIREIMQAGVELIGDVDLCAAAEVVTLACRALAGLGTKSILEISHMGIVSAVIDMLGTDEETKKAAAGYISAKNVPAIRRLCEEKRIPAGLAHSLCSLASLYGTFDEVLPEVRGIVGAANEAYRELEQLGDVLERCGFGDVTRIDFSASNDMEYYGGIIFRGYVPGVPKAVLSGGRYDALMTKFGKNGGAVGFAIYMDLLEHYFPDREEADAAVMCYTETDDAADVLSAAQKLRENGLCVKIQKSAPADTSDLAGVYKVKGGGEYEKL